MERSYCHIMKRIKTAHFLHFAVIFINGLNLRSVNGFTVEKSGSAPRFDSLMDLQNYHLWAGAKTKTKENLSKWNKWKKWPLLNSLGGPLNEGILQQDVYRSHPVNFPELNHFNSLDHATPTLFIGKHTQRVRNRKRGGKGRKPSMLDKLIISKVRSTPSVQFWSKRDTDPKQIPHSPSSDGSNTPNTTKLTLVDSELENLTPDSRCTEKLGLCAKMPTKSMECLLHCHLSSHALAQPSTKFLFRLLKVFTTFPKMLCPTFGQIYNDIPSIIKEAKGGNSLRGFLSDVGFVEKAPVNVDFIKNSPSVLFNNLVKFGQGEDLDLVQSTVDAAETATKLQLSEKNLFPSMYGNPSCKLAPKEGWYVSMIDAVTKHPTLSDIFLRGYWIMTRGLSLELIPPLDGLFLSFVYSIKLLAGVDCSIIAYAEQGKPFKCKQPPPIDNILGEYETAEKEQEQENTFSWVVCGAHQVEIPDWIQTKEGLKGKSGAIDDSSESNSTTLEGTTSSAGLNDELAKFPNPDEENSSEDK